MEPYKHYFSGKCDPVNGTDYKTFSVGTFQAIPRANGKGCKRGPVKVRVKGLSSRPKMVYDMAAHICRTLDTLAACHTDYTGRKTISVIGRTERSLFE